MYSICVTLIFGAITIFSKEKFVQSKNILKLGTASSYDTSPKKNLAI